MCGTGMRRDFRRSGKGTVKTEAPRLTVIDDSPEWATFVKEAAERENFSATALTNHRDYPALAKAAPPDVLVLDLFMPEKDGIEIILGMEHVDDRPFIILISGQSRSFLESAVSLGRGRGLEIIGALAKPFRFLDLKALLQKAAKLVEQKKRLRSEIEEATHDVRRTGEADDRGTTADQGRNTKRHLQKLDGSAVGKLTAPNILEHLFESDGHSRLGGNGHSSLTEDSLRRSIAEVNRLFCLILWDTQQGTLNALKIVPSRLAEAAAGLIAEKDSGTESKSGWYAALSLHTKTLVDNQAAIRDIANTLRLPARGQSATEAIDRISTVVGEILAAQRGKGASPRAMLASFRKLCDANKCLKKDFAALLLAVNNAMAVACGAAVGLSAQAHPTPSDGSAERPKQRLAMASRSGSSLWPRNIGLRQAAPFADKAHFSLSPE